MPARNYSPIAYLSCSFSLAQLAGEDLYTDDSGTVTAGAGFGTFRNLRDLLNGYGSPALRTVKGVCDTALTVGGLPGSFQVAITDSDRIRWTYSGGAFQLKALSASNPFGLSTSYVAAVAGKVTAAADWTRGNVDLADCTLRIKVGSTETDAFFDEGQAQDVLTLIRGWAADALCTAPAHNLTATDGRLDVRFVLSDAGKVQCWRSASYGDLTWESEELATFLGFRGDETAEIVGSSQVLEATDSPLTVLWLNRPIEYCEPKIRSNRSVVRNSAGASQVTHTSTIKGWNVRVCVTGIGSTEDQTDAAWDGFFPYLLKADSFSVFQDAGEPRIAVSRRNVYSAVQTPEDNYRTGVLDLVLDDQAQEYGFDLEDPQVRLRYYFDLPGWLKV